MQKLNMHAYLSKASSHTVFTAAAKYLNALRWIPDLSNRSSSSSQIATCSKTHCILPRVIRGENRTQHTQAWYKNTQGKTPWRIKKARLIQQDLSTTFRSGCKSAKVSRLFLILKGRSRFMAVSAHLFLKIEVLVSLNVCSVQGLFDRLSSKKAEAQKGSCQVSGACKLPLHAAPSHPPASLVVTYLQWICKVTCCKVGLPMQAN